MEHFFFYSRLGRLSNLGYVCLDNQIEYEKNIINELNIEKYLNANNLITKYDDIYDELDNTNNELYYSDSDTDSDTDSDSCEYIYNEELSDIYDKIDLGEFLSCSFKDSSFSLNSCALF